jgi:hypothetical protein
VLSFNIQAFIAIAVSFYSFVLNLHKKGNRIVWVKPTRANRLELQRIANKILVQGSDVQSMNGQLVSRKTLRVRTAY